MENNNQTPIQDNTNDYLEEIENLKKNTVSREQYNKILEDNKKLIQTVARNNGRTEEEEEQPKMTEDEFKEYLSIASSTSINIPSYKRMDAIMKVRNYTLENTGVDIFLDPNDEDLNSKDAAELFAEGMTFVLEESDGPKNNHENRFNTELAGIIVGR